MQAIPIFPEYAPVMRPDRYNVRESEAKWRKAWADAEVFKTENGDPRPKYYVLKMFPLRGRGSTWDMSATTRWATWWPDTGAREGSMSSIRWAGTPSACRPKMPRGQIQQPAGKWTYHNIADDARPAQVDGARRSIGRARSRPAIPAATSASRGCFSTFLRSRAGRRARRRRSTGSGRSDRARQRAGDRRARLALRRTRRAARTDPMVPQEHRTARRRSARKPRSRSSVGRKRCKADAEELDRAVGGIGAAGSYIRRRWGPPRGWTRDKRGFEVYTTRPDTLFGAKFMAIAARPSAGRCGREARPGRFMRSSRRRGSAIRLNKLKINKLNNR